MIIKVMTAQLKSQMTRRAERTSVTAYVYLCAGEQPRIGLAGHPTKNFDWTVPGS